MDTKQKFKMEQQFAVIQDAVLDLQKEFDIVAPDGPQAVRSCTSCLSNSCNQPAEIASQG